MKIEVKQYTYETMPDYSDEVPGAKEIVMDPGLIGVEYYPDVVYCSKDGVDLVLQLLVPTVFNDPDRIYPCVLFVKGSAWMEQRIHINVGSLAKLAEKGYVVGIVQYRHSGIAHFPAQVIDAKNAIRFMKANAEQYHVDKEKVIIMGGSSGGHTSAIAGMTSQTDKLDEPMNDENCHVKGIISLYGAVEVTLEDGFPTTENHQLPDSPEGKLMGYNIREHMEEAQAANAKTYVNEDFPPVLLLHGSKDKTVSCQESVNLYNALKEAGKDVELYIVRGSDHGGNAFFSNEATDIYDKFIQRCLAK